jgi:hypothetical protein
MVADGAGGMVKVQDLRFEPAGHWPISFEINGEHADTWLRYFNAECAKRGWSDSGIGQLEASENSGSITVSTGADRPTLAVVWERRGGKSLRVRARSGEAAEFLPAEAQEFFDRVNQRCESGAVERVYRRYWLEYEGLPWCGELWLDNTLRLSPPSLQDDTALKGPRAIIVDSLVTCIGSSEAGSVFNGDLGELAAFLSVVMGTAVRVPPTKRAWTSRLQRMAFSTVPSDSSGTGSPSSTIQRRCPSEAHVAQCR